MTDDARYLCYDLKGIQSYIFAIPKLKYICGGSAILDRFDRETVKGLGIPGTELLFAGGGKGAFFCESGDAANLLQGALVEKAHEEGLTICFGRHVDYSEAAHHADRMFPYLPKGEELDGQPCKVSGLYPTTKPDGIHDKVGRRIWQRGDRLDRWFESQLIKDMVVPQKLSAAKRLEFIHNVDSEDEDGRYGASALGDRNRWAIICMDGNDMGNQHRRASELWKDDPQKMTRWIGEMSKALDECSRGACRCAIECVLNSWTEDEKGGQECAASQAPAGTAYLPVRPLIVGGDDITVICHVRHAIEFVREACWVFNEKSKELAQKAKEQGIDMLWPATNNELTISAGILFAPVTLPLASAIPFAESLLASAKSEGRKNPEPERPSPACIDWESVTEGLVETPAARRQRELFFKDQDIEKKVELTMRPYRLDRFERELIPLIGEYKDIPATIRHQVLPGLLTGYWDRRVFVARLGKNKDRLKLVQDLWEEQGKECGRWKVDPKDKTRETDVVDALLLLEEETRMSRETT